VDKDSKARAADDRSGGRFRGRRDDDGFARRRGPRVLGVKEININDAEFLRQFLTEYGKILPARLSGLSAQQQRQVKRGIRRCRVVGLLP